MALINYPAKEINDSKLEQDRINYFLGRAPCLVEGLREIHRTYSEGGRFFSHHLENFWEADKIRDLDELRNVVNYWGTSRAIWGDAIKSCVGVRFGKETISTTPWHLYYVSPLGIMTLGIFAAGAYFSKDWRGLAFASVLGGLFGAVSAEPIYSRADFNVFSETADEIEKRVDKKKRFLKKQGIL